MATAVNQDFSQMSRVALLTRLSEMVNGSGPEDVRTIVDHLLAEAREAAGKYNAAEFSARMNRLGRLDLP